MKFYAAQMDFVIPVEVHYIYPLVVEDTFQVSELKPFLSWAFLKNKKKRLYERSLLGITTFYNDMILYTLSISSHGFVLGFPKGHVPYQ